MSNILIGYSNKIEGATLAGGTWSNLDNIKDTDLDTYAQVTSIPSDAKSRFTIDLGAAYPLRVIAVLAHATGATGQWRVRADTGVITLGAAFTGLYDSGTINLKQTTFQVNNSAADWLTAQGKYMLAVYPTVTARYISVEFFSAGPGNGVQIGRMFVGPGFSPARNANWGLADHQLDFSGLLKSSSGKVFTAAVARRLRKVALAYPWLTETEAQLLHEIQGTHGITEEVLYVPDPADAAKSQYYGFLGRLEQLDPLEFPSFANRAASVVISEKI